MAYKTQSPKSAKGKRLLIVESPAKAKTIGKYLGDDFVVVASVGHIRDLPKSNKKAVDIEHGFLPHYEISKGKEDVVKSLKKLSEEASEVLLATDPDREGEAIAWHVVEATGIKKPKRVVFNEITKDAVTEAVAHPRDIDQNLRTAQEARRVLDRLVGYDLSGLIWKKVRYGLSAGRVQSPALRILMEREREIRAFKPESYWVIEGSFQTKNGDTITLTCTEEPRDKTVVDDILTKGRSHDWIITDIKETKAKRSPKSPFTTSTLQQAASSRLGFSPSRTMAIAQKLYEAGHITYMRTDSTTLSGQAYGQIKGYVEKTYGLALHQNRAYKTKSKNAQEAHEAVRPTNCLKESAGNTDEQKRLYRLIWQRTVASQMKDAEIMRTRIEANITPKNIPVFYVTGSRVMSPGWLMVDPEARGEDVELPKVSVDESLSRITLEAEGKETQPPSRYTEAGLVKELEKRGIGRPSTYASIIKTLVDREYVTKEGRTLFPTDTGDVVSTFLEHNFTNYISDSFTAEMENELDEIAEGKREYAKTLEEFYKPFTKDIKAKEDSPKITDLGKADSKWTCPKCQSAMVIKLGRGGKFMSCEKFPDCDGARTIDGEEIKEAEPLGVDPETELPVFVLDGRYGPYVQLGEKTDKNKKPKRASIPKDMKMDDVTLEEALKFLSLPRVLGTHPETHEEIVANNGRFGPYIVHNGDFRSLKEDNVYDIKLERALEILKEPKKTRRGRKKK